MNPQTVGLAYDVGRIALIECKLEDNLKDLDIKDKCFLMIIVDRGKVKFKVKDTLHEAIAPCVICFDERTNPVLVSKKGLKCYSVYFHPSFLNPNMTFELVHSDKYSNIGTAHDMFLMKPFTDTERFIYPLFYEHIENLRQLIFNLKGELEIQRDWYWTCRTRSYFMEVMLVLERLYGIIDTNNEGVPVRSINSINNYHLKNAIIFIESHYRDNILRSDIASAASINVNSLSELFREELDVSPMEYLLNYRISVAKRKLEFTELSIKEVAEQSGFKTESLFCKKFVQVTGMTAKQFRKQSVEKRKEAFAKDS